MRKLATAAFAFSAAIFAANIILPPRLILPLAIAGLVLAVIALALRAGIRLRLFLTLMLFAAGLFWQLGFEAIYRAPADKHAGNTATVEAVAIGYPSQGSYGDRLRIRVKQPGVDLNAVLYLSGFDSGITPGDVIELTARFEPSGVIRGEETDVFYARGEFLLAYQSGKMTIIGRESAFWYFPQKLVHSVSDMAGTLFGDTLGPFMRALLVGDTAELNRDTALSGALSVTGAAHIVSVSGMHLVFLMGFLGLVIRRKRLFAVVAAPLIVLFMAMTGFAPPMVRAGVMQLFLLTAPLVKRESDGVTSLSAALLILLAVNPYASRSVGLQLSFAATLGMILFTGRLGDAIDNHLRDRGLYEKKPARFALRFVTSSLASTVGALAFTVPLTALHFGMVSLIAPVTNLVTLWAVSLAFCIGLAACASAFIVPPIGLLLARVASLPAGYMLHAVKALARVPYAAVYVGNTLVLIWLVYVYALVILLAALRARLRQLIYPACSCVLTLCFILLITPRLSAVSGDMSVTALDIGQGQCVVIRSGGYTALADCGSSSGERAGAVAHEYLTSGGAMSVDLLVLTHFHADHANGVEYLLGMMNVATLAVPDPDISESYLAEDIIELARRRGTDIIYITQTMTATLGNAVLTLYPPLGDEDENERGLAILASGGGLTALITGDMDARGERRLLRFTELPDIDVLIAGHHGSRYSTSEELLIATMPEIALISVGHNNYGHPAEETLALFAECGVTVYRTDLFGSITVGGRPATEETDGETEEG